MEKLLIQIGCLVVMCIAVNITFTSRQIVDKIKNIKDRSSAAKLFSVSGFVVTILALYIIYINL